MRFIAYSPKNGEVLGVYTVDGDVLPIFPEGSDHIPVMDGEVLPEFFYINKEKELIEVPPSPDPFFIFCHEIKEWVCDPDLLVVVKTYDEERSEAYPDMGDQLDAIYKGFDSIQKQGFQLPKETLDWMGEIKEVKDTFKKE